MRWAGTQNQSRQDHLFRSDVVMTGSALLVLPRAQSRSQLILQNLGSGAMAIEIGSARAHCAITSGKVSSVSIDNGGFGFTKPPIVVFYGGGTAGNGSYLGLGQPGGEAPPHPAKGIAVLSGGAVASITITDPGSGYVIAPFVFMYDSDLDPYGAALPSVTGFSGINLPANMTVPIAWQGSACPTDPIAVIGTSMDVLFCGWMD